MLNAGLDDSQAITNLRIANDITLMAESGEELKSLLMKVEEESEKTGLKLSIQKMKIMASDPITSWQIGGETMETVRDFLFLGSKITVDTKNGKVFFFFFFFFSSEVLLLTCYNSVFGQFLKIVVQFSRSVMSDFLWHFISTFYQVALHFNFVLDFAYYVKQFCNEGFS